jgi:hypothetical protein
VSGADLAGPVADAAIEDLRALASVLERDLLRILLQLDTQPGEDSLVRRQGQTAAAVYRQIVSRLEQEGATIASVTGARALQAVEAVVGAPPAALPLDVRRELDQIVSAQVADVVRVFGDSADLIRRAAQQGIASGGSLGEIVAMVQEQMRTTWFRAQSAVDAAIMATGRRSVIADAAAAEAEGVDLVYLYVGPRDGKNRPFCAQWVGKAVLDPSTMDNGQKLPVEDYCGGYNCRHSWAPTITSTAIESGYRIHDTSGATPVDVTERLRAQGG